MTETYVSLGLGSSEGYAYLGGAFLAVGVGLFLSIRVKPRTPRWRTNALMVTLFGLLLIVCGLFELPLAVYWLGFLLISLVPMYRSEPPSKPIARLVWVVFALAFALIFGWATSIQRITIADNVVTTTPTGLDLRRLDFKGSADRSGVHIDETMFPSYGFIRPKPWVEWHIYSGNPTGENGIYTHSQEWYWGPHGPVTGNQLALRIETWAGVSPKVTTRK